MLTVRHVVEASLAAGDRGLDLGAAGGRHLERVLARDRRARVDARPSS
jgi:hypothetical protein